MAHPSPSPGWHVPRDKESQALGATQEELPETEDQTCLTGRPYMQRPPTQGPYELPALLQRLKDPMSYPPCSSAIWMHVSR